MEAGFILIFILFALLAIAFIIYGIYAAKKRREELGQLAARLGFQFSPDDPFAIPRRYEAFAWISQGHNRSAYNVLHGRVDVFDVKAFDYVYYTTETSTDSKGNTTSREVSHYFSAVIFDAPVSFPPLLIRPEHFFDRIAAAIGFDDINFESHEFSRAFYVKSPNKKFAYDVIHPRMMEYLLAHRGWSLQVGGSSLMVYQGSTFSTEQFRQAIDFVHAFLKLVPEFVWENLGLHPNRGQTSRQ